MPVQPATDRLSFDRWTAEPTHDRPDGRSTRRVDTGMLPAMPFAQHTEDSARRTAGSPLPPLRRPRNDDTEIAEQPHAQRAPNGLTEDGRTDALAAGAVPQFAPADDGPQWPLVLASGRARA